MLSLALFRRARFSAANVVSFLMYAGLFGAVFLMSQFFQSAQHHTPLETGVRLLAWTAPPMVVSPLAGKLADRYGNRPFMAAGMGLQGIGLGWIALTVTAHIGYPTMGIALLVAGTGTALVFPTVANEVVATVPETEIGIASGTNSALRELGGVFGVAVLAAVFTRPGVYTSASTFVDGFKPALWVGAAFSALGVLAALSTLRRRRPTPEPAAPVLDPIAADLAQEYRAPLGAYREPADTGADHERVASDVRIR